jgi:hypothetical protein
MQQLRQDYGAAVRQFNKDLGVGGRAMLASGPGPLVGQEDALRTATLTSGQPNAAERVAAATALQEQQAAGQAAAQAEQERQMRIFGNQLLEIGQNALRPLDTGFRGLGTAAIQATSELIGDKKFKDSIKAISDTINGYVVQLQTGIKEGRGIASLMDIGSKMGTEFENRASQLFDEMIFRPGTGNPNISPQRPGSTPGAPGETPGIYERLVREAWARAQEEMVRGARETMGAVRDSFTNGVNGMFNSIRQSVGLPTSTPGRARGGTAGPGSYLVGENGPEVVNLGSRGDVITNENLTALLQNTTNQNGLKESIETLNNISGQMLSTLKDISDINKRTLTATRNLNGNLFAA